MIPFSGEVFFAVLQDYNLAMWPVHALAYVLAIVIVVLAYHGTAIGGRLIAAIMAAAWCWLGIGFVDQVFTPLLWASWMLKTAFLVEAGMFAVMAIMPRPIQIRLAPDNRSWTAGLIFILCAILYPVLAAQWNHAWPSAQLLGAAPAPTAVFTIGLLLLAPSRFAKLLAVIPALFLLITAYLGVGLAIWEDVLLAAIGLAGLAIMVFPKLLVESKKQ